MDILCSLIFHLSEDYHDTCDTKAKCHIFLSTGVYITVYNTKILRLFIIDPSCRKRKFAIFLVYCISDLALLAM